MKKYGLNFLSIKCRFIFYISLFLFIVSFSFKPLFGFRDNLREYGFYEWKKVKAYYRLDCCNCLSPPRIYEVKIEDGEAEVFYKSCPQYPHLWFPEKRIEVKLNEDTLRKLVKLHIDADFFNLRTPDIALVLDAGEYSMSYQFGARSNKIDYISREEKTLKDIENFYEKIIDLAEVREIEQKLKKEEQERMIEQEKIAKRFISSDKALDIIRNLPEVVNLFQVKISGRGAGVGVWRHPTPENPVYVIKVSEHFEVGEITQESIFGYCTVDAFTGKIIKIGKEIK